MLANSSKVMGGKAGGSNVAAKIAHLRESFTIFDLDCDGVLSFREIKMVPCNKSLSTDHLVVASVCP